MFAKGDNSKIRLNLMVNNSIFSGYRVHDMKQVYVVDGPSEILYMKQFTTYL